MMDPEKRKALEESGWMFGDAEDFLEFVPEEPDFVSDPSQSWEQLSGLNAVRNLMQSIDMPEWDFENTQKPSNPKRLAS